MIPRLVADHGGTETLSAPQGLFDALVEAGFSGDFDRSQAGRIVHATDNSIYQVKPSGIVFPHDAGDLQILARVLSRPEFRDQTIAPRGGGTGTNGQSLTPGLVVDCSRHMNRILHIDPVRRRARVQAGVVKDQLNQALRPHGLFFAPELSTSNRATIGGMISTDACGQGSCVYGKTSAHVLGLRLVLTDGTDFWSEPVDDAGLTGLAARPDRIGDAIRTLRDIERDEAETIARIFPKLNRYMTGYDLAHLRDGEGRFDLNAVICGSEGTLAFVAEAELNLLPIPAHAALIVIQYADFNAALEDARFLTGLKVASVETVDEKVLGLAKGDSTWPGIASFFPEDASMRAEGVNIVEILGDTPDEITEGLARVSAAMTAEPFAARGAFTHVRAPADIAAIWNMRKRAVGLLGNVEGATRPLPFVEDTAVPPENLAPYIREFRALLDAEGVSYGMFGHVDAGVLHVRPALDLTQAPQREKVRRISDAVVALTRKHGGVLWGEHGKGIRSEYVPEYFGPLYPALQRIKAAFDPENRLNPGKIAAPEGAALLAIDAVPMRGDFDRAIAPEIRAGFDNGPYCNGNGACFDFDTGNVMCPSYKATRDRRHSPKGRASLLREWLRLLAAEGVDPRAAAVNARLENPLKSLLRRGWNTLNPANRNDFSHEVQAAMAGCLSCKACAGQCPVKVDVPSFRAKFLELYYSRYLRPLRHPLVAGIESLLPWATRAAPAYNLAVGSRAGRALLGVVGLTALPRLAPRAARRLDAPVASVDALMALPPEARRDSVILVIDPFTANFDPEIAQSAIRLARAMGLHPWLAPQMQNGKPLHVHGHLGPFARRAAQTAEQLGALTATGATLVGLDPSMTLAFRSEYAKAGATPPEVLLPQEWLHGALNRLPPLTRPTGPHSLLLHCTERSNAATAAALWPQIFRALGLEIAMPALGCCGMAGTFGHEKANRPVSETLFSVGWQQAVSEDGVVMATGFSCRHQASEIADRTLPHPLTVLAKLLPTG